MGAWISTGGEMYDTPSRVSGSPSHSPLWGQSGVQEGVRRESPSKEYQSRLGKQQVPEEVGVGEDEKGLPTLLAAFWVGFLSESGRAAGSPWKGPGGPSGVTFATYYSPRIREGAIGQGLGASAWRSGAKAHAVAQPAHLRGQRPPVLAWPGIKLSVAAFQGSTQKKGGRNGRRCFHASCFICIR